MWPNAYPHASRTGGSPQSRGQVQGFSPTAGEHRPSPHRNGQSVGQVSGISVPLQTRSPQPGGQSRGQSRAVSSPLHTPSPHCDGQSLRQVTVVSSPLHAPSPHRGLQSARQVGSRSSWVHAPSPHTAGQSLGQVTEVSSPAQHWSPQRVTAPGVGNGAASAEGRMATTMSSAAAAIQYRLVMHRAPSALSLRGFAGRVNVAGARGRRRARCPRASLNQGTAVIRPTYHTTNVPCRRPTRRLGTGFLSRRERSGEGMSYRTRSVTAAACLKEAKA